MYSIMNKKIPTWGFFILRTRDFISILRHATVVPGMSREHASCPGVPTVL